MELDEEKIDQAMLALLVVLRQKLAHAILQEHKAACVGIIEM
jgi:hypothetical protein